MRNLRIDKLEAQALPTEGFTILLLSINSDGTYTLDDEHKTVFTRAELDAMIRERNIAPYAPDTICFVVEDDAGEE